MQLIIIWHWRGNTTNKIIRNILHEIDYQQQPFFSYTTLIYIAERSLVPCFSAILQASIAIFVREASKFSPVSADVF